ncbi:MAG: hypothetical protein EB127_05370 [Alphaproteobacteria bacterium]|nr:hypothetical protein [Alphaproteobacteria bacterium]
MAFTFIPKNYAEVAGKAIFKPYIEDYFKLFNYFNENFAKINYPFALDTTSPNKVKVTRRISPINLSNIKNSLKIKLNLAYGEGSRKSGTAEQKINLGNQFEINLVTDINKYIKGDTISDKKNEKFINEFIQYYKLSTLDRVVPMGELNQKRPLQFTSSGVFIGTTGDPNIGSIVTDINVEGQQKNIGKTIFLSLKYGKKVTFANPGVATIFPEKDFKANKLNNPNAHILIDMFGISEAKFIATFESYSSGKMFKDNENTFGKIDKRILQNFIKSGIGYGYHMVHLLGPSIKHKEMTRTYLEQAATPKSCTVYYGGLGGTAAGKRVDILVETNAYKLQFNLRSKSGGIYPTHLMIDYEYI